MDESLSKNGSTRSTTSIARIMQLCIIVTRLFWPRYVEMKFTVAGSERQRVTRRSLHQIYSSLGRRGGKGWTSHPKINPVNNRRDRAPFAPEILNQGEGNGDHGYTRSLGKARYRCLESKWMLSFDLNNFPKLDGIGKFLERRIAGNIVETCCRSKRTWIHLLVWENWERILILWFNVKSRIYFSRILLETWR